MFPNNPEINNINNYFLLTDLELTILNGKFENHDSNKIK